MEKKREKFLGKRLKFVIRVSKKTGKYQKTCLNFVMLEKSEKEIEKSFWKKKTKKVIDDYLRMNLRFT